MDRKVIPGKHLLYKELVQRDIVHNKDSVLGKIHNLSALLLQIAGKPHFGSDTGELLEMRPNNKREDIISTIESMVDYDKNIKIVTMPSC